MSAPRIIRPTTEPYVRAMRGRGVIAFRLDRGARLEACPFIARRLAARLLAAADRLDPNGKARAPWEGKGGRR
jgi:2-keto-3-deoxy-L-rhamnonate aldolase RhmA